ncbi:MAG TPA: MFS transporter [Candidatus Dormibacteraeota bacterium]|nr:MFS transporter [Candidatus Dormibacteraeota bacterium]
MIEPNLWRPSGSGTWARASTPLILFVALGLPAGAIGVAWPHMRESLGAPLAGLGLLLAAWTIAYFVASASSGPVTASFGTPILLLGGCTLAAAGALGLALSSGWWMIPLAAFLLGGGSGLIDAAVNAHVSLNRGVRYMGWLHASWAVGAALGPQAIVISLAATGSWRAAFGVMALAFLGIGLVVATRRRDWAGGASSTPQQPPTRVSAGSSYRRALLLLAGLFLMGAGLEATAGDWSYTQLTAGRSVPAELASLSASLFWAGLAGGRVALGLFGNRATPARLLDAGVALAVLAALGFWLGPPLVSAFIALPILGIAVSLIFPLLLSLTPERVGTAMTPHTVGYGLAAGNLGAGGIPAGAGLVLQSAGVLALGPILAFLAVAMAILHAVSRFSGPGRRQSLEPAPGRRGS